MNDIAIYERLLVVAAGISIAGLVCLVWHWLNRPRGSKAYRTGHATVVSRRVEQTTGKAKGVPYASSRKFSTWVYLVTFDLGTTRLELQVQEGDYKRLKEGLTGTLEWQYEYLMSFEPDTP